MKPLAHAKAPASVAFHLAIFEEHVDEAAFLYEQRQARLIATGETWRGAASLEDRLDVRIDALVVGRAAALAVCVERAEAGGPAELFVALCVFCRVGDAALVAAVLRGLAYTDADKVKAVCNALCFELPDAWAGFVEKALLRGDTTTASLLASVSACRRLPVGGALLKALNAAPSPPLAVVEALGRLKVREAAAALQACLLGKDPELQSAALLALCHLGVYSALQQACAPIRQQSWGRIAVGLAGDRYALALLQQLADEGLADASALMAIGLQGDPVALPTLLAHLSQPALQQPAALALHWITGAALFEDSFVPEPVDEAELSAAELQAWRKHGQAPVRADGRPFGDKITQLTGDANRWQNWLHEHGAGLQPGRRYRLGQPCTPRVLLDSLLDARSDSLLRHFAAQELAIRYGCDIPLSLELPVASQLRQLRQLGNWVDAEQLRFAPGSWYFDGTSQ